MIAWLRHLPLIVRHVAFAAGWLSMTGPSALALGRGLRPERSNRDDRGSRWWR